MKAELIQVMGNDRMVADVARLSFDATADDYPESRVSSLIKYLATHGHWSPFSHPKAMIKLEMPIFVARQWEKHRIGAIRGYDIYDQNEVSRRYVDTPPEFFTPSTWRARPDKSIKQGSAEALERHVQYKAEQTYTNALEHCQKAYEALLEWGVAPEQARMVLPQSMYTTWVETGSLAYWARLINQRTDPHAQSEIRTLAYQISNEMREVFPISWEALIK